MPSQDVWKFTPVSYRTSALWGRCPALTPIFQLITPSRASGTADHVRSLDDLFSLHVSFSSCLISTVFFCFVSMFAVTVSAVSPLCRRSSFHPISKSNSFFLLVFLRPFCLTSPTSSKNWFQSLFQGLNYGNNTVESQLSGTAI